MPDDHTVIEPGIVTTKESKSEQAPLAPTPGGSKRARRGSPVMIVAIIASAVVVLACIVASAFVAYMFIQQALWYVYG